ncbi:hemerythrin domain-containing protein, partial [Crossiella sp. NPDC003009]
MSQDNNGHRDTEDVIDLLQRQHQEIRGLFAELETAGAERRGDLFRDLVRLLAVHETAEEEVVHPEVKRLENGEPVVAARIGEEHRAKQLLSTLDEIGPDAEVFDTLLRQLRDDVLAHAEHEERDECPVRSRSVMRPPSPERPRAPSATTTRSVCFPSPSAAGTAA